MLLHQPQHVSVFIQPSTVFCHGNGSFLCIIQDLRLADSMQVNMIVLSQDPSLNMSHMLGISDQTEKSRCLCI